MPSHPPPLTYNGLTLTQREWARHLGIDERRISERRKAHLPIEQILSRTLLRQRQQDQPMQYCRTHHRAWCVGIQEGAHWHPLAPATLAYAQAYAQVFGCREIVVQDVRCDQCIEEAR